MQQSAKLTSMQDLCLKSGPHYSRMCKERQTAASAAKEDMGLNLVRSFMSADIQFEKLKVVIFLMNR